MNNIQLYNGDCLELMKDIPDGLVDLTVTSILYDIRRLHIMNKVDMIATMAEVSGLSKKDCEAALTAFLAATEKALKAGDKVQLVGFGSFEAKERAARIGRNPATGAEVKIPASKVPAFKPGKAFKDAIQ